MIDSGSVTIEGVSSIIGTDKQSGCQIKFSQTIQDLVSEVHKSATFIERTGKLGLKIGGKMILLVGMLRGATTYAAKVGATGQNMFVFKTGERLSGKQMAAIHDDEGEVVDFSFEDEQKEMKFPEEANEPVEAATDL